MVKAFHHLLLLILLISLELVMGCKKREEMPSSAPAPAPAPQQSIMSSNASKINTTASNSKPILYADITSNNVTIAKHLSDLNTNKFVAKLNDALESNATIQPERKLYWNVWTENPNNPMYQPITFLKPGENYKLVIDLATVMYKAAGATSTESGPNINNKIPKWLEPGVSDPNLTVLFIPDQGRFVNSPESKSLKINLQRLRKAWESGLTTDVKDPFKSLEEAHSKNELPPGFKLSDNYDNTFFDILPKDTEGPASVAFSIWYQDRPVDEVSFQVCIANSPEIMNEKCKDMKQPLNPQGIVSVFTTKEGNETPIVAVHFVSLGDKSPVMGVFRKESKDDAFLVWKLDQDLQKFQKNISTSGAYLNSISPNLPDENLLSRGQGLFSYLFPKMSADGKKVQEEFLGPLKKYLEKNSEEKDYLPRSIYVRMINTNPTPSLPIPLGLMAIRLDDNKEMTIDNGRFLGKYFIIESPLEIQANELTNDCLSRWVMVMPPEKTVDTTINNIRLLISEAIDKYKSNAYFPKSMNEFNNWLYKSESDPPTAIITLSHQNKGSLYFSDNSSVGDNPLLSSMINKTFGRSSIAIINGCESASGEGADELLQRLNKQGFSTIIATNTPIDGSMAAGFLIKFLEEIESITPGKSEPIGDVYWRTIRNLSKARPKTDIKAKEFGANALKFTLLGNRNTRICAPNKAYWNNIIR